MSKRKDGQERSKYTLEFKLEAVRLVKGGQAVPVTAKILGVPTQTLGNWVRLANSAKSKGRPCGRLASRPLTTECGGIEPMVKL